jgi:hypothetical protein
MNPVITSEFERAVPRIERHGRVAFRGLRCQHEKEECLAEMVALCFLWWGRLLKQGKDPSQFISALATFAARQVRDGRRLCGQRSKDVMSPRAQVRHQLSVSTLDEALTDNMQTPVPEQVIFRLDFPQWLGRLSERNRELALAMALGHHTEDLAENFRITPGRVSQLRAWLHDHWQLFQATG